MQNQKGNIALIIAGIVAVAILVGGVGYFVAKKPAQKEELAQEERKSVEILGGDKDEHGCIGSAGYFWCDIKQKCLRSWEEECKSEIKDETADWKIYRNEKYGFEMKYPNTPELEIYENEPEVGEVPASINFHEINLEGHLTSPFISIQILSDVVGLGLQKEYEDRKTEVEKEEIVINDVVVPVYKINPINKAERPRTQVFLKSKYNNLNVLDISIFEEFTQNLHIKILSTFKFIK